MRIYDLRTEKPKGKAGSMKIMPWPVNAWTCFVPKNVSENINIFEKLIFSLIDKKIVSSKSDIQYILTNDVGLDSELVENILENFWDKHVNKNYKNQILLKERSLEDYRLTQDDYSQDMKMSDEMKKVYLFQDLVTNVVIPCFNVDKIPEFYEEIEDNDMLVKIPNIGTNQQPKTAEINVALQYWKRLKKLKDNNENPQNNRIEIDDEIKFEEGITEEPTTLEQKEQLQSNVDSITIYDDKPTFLFLKSYVEFNPDNPDSIEIESPFGSDFDNWFMKIVNRKRLTDKKFNEDLQLFLLDKKELFKAEIAFDNDLDIQLFNEFPMICNDEKYSSLKKSILDISKAYKRISEGDSGEYSNFVSNMRTSLEVLFREVMKANPEIYKTRQNYSDDFCRNRGFKQYEYAIESLINYYRMNRDLYNLFNNRQIWQNMVNEYNNVDRGNPKDNAAILICYASENIKSDIAKFVNDYQNLFVDMFDLIKHGNNEIHGNYHSNSLSDVTDDYIKYEEIVRKFYEFFIGGEKNGEEKTEE